MLWESIRIRFVTLYQRAVLGVSKGTDMTVGATGSIVSRKTTRI